MQRFEKLFNSIIQFIMNEIKSFFEIIFKGHPFEKAEAQRYGPVLYHE